MYSELWITYSGADVLTLGLNKTMRVGYSVHNYKPEELEEEFMFIGLRINGSKIECIHIPL